MTMNMFLHLPLFGVNNPDLLLGDALADTLDEEMFGFMMDREDSTLEKRVLTCSFDFFFVSSMSRQGSMFLLCVVRSV